VLAMLHWLGIKPSYSRPRVSDDNAFAEALFRTVKYWPEFPSKGFAELDAARQWAVRFVQWCFGLCNGTTMSIVIAASATSPRGSVMPARIDLCSRPATPSIKMRGTALLDAGAGRPETGRRSPPSRSTPKRDTLVQAATSQIQLSYSIGTSAFPSRPGDASPRPATQGMGGAEPPRAMRSIASTGPSPQ
jgi:putative transposase